MQALVVIFSRIVDVERFSEVVLSAVREEEKRELQHRLGLLNVLNPVRVRNNNAYDTIEVEFVRLKLVSE